MTAPVSFPASHLDLLHARNVGVLSTLGRGFPQSTAIWFLLDGDVIRTSLHTSRQKYRNLLRDPHTTLFLLDPANPYRSLEVRADATFVDDADQSFFGRIVRHYGQDPRQVPGTRRQPGRAHPHAPTSRRQRMNTLPADLSIDDRGEG